MNDLALERFKETKPKCIYWTAVSFSEANQREGDHAESSLSVSNQLLNVR